MSYHIIPESLNYSLATRQALWHLYMVARRERSYQSFKKNFEVIEIKIVNAYPSTLV